LNLTDCNFSINHYLDCIAKAQDNDFVIGSVSDYPYFFELEKFLILRHDVDFTLEYAVEMARAEAEHDIRSTYYILLHSETYNPLSPKNMKIIKEIKNLGHEIGWHVDTRYLIPDEAAIISSIAETEIESYAQHFYTLTEKPHFTGLENSMEINAKYISDSSMNWREGCLCTNLDKYDRLQVLTHPVWWVTEKQYRWSAVAELTNRLVLDQLNAMDDYRDILKKYLESGDNERLQDPIIHTITERNTRFR